ncbi:MAG: FdhF/YdeP family oxidoreductase [Planctomycetaceae bacterium]|nr:FdhF/YdeP family oxidoreductase [Planctomycetaceae bacterium]
MDVDRVSAHDQAGGDGLANYHPRHHVPHPPRETAHAHHAPQGCPETEHGDVDPLTSEKLTGLRQTKPERKATGLGAVISSFHYVLSEAGVVRGTLPMLQINQKDGFDCAGCAWPDPDGRRSAFDFCENGAKAIAHESDRRRATPEFFAAHSVAELSRQSDYWLEQQGRLTEPMVLRAGATHYQPIPWEEAFSLIAAELNALASPNEASFYTSGKATNEAAFAYQLFVRQFGTNNLPDCSNMCHEASGTALNNVLGFGKGTVKLEDFAKAKQIFVVGHNPGTNHPRMLTALQEAKLNGAKIVAVNPLPETGLISFMQPQSTSGLLGRATTIADLFLQVRINGDVPLFKGILKSLVEAEDQRSGAAVAWGFVQANTAGVEALLDDVRRADWDDIERASGIERAQIEMAAGWARETDRIICSWCVGVAQHHNGVANVQEILNLLLLRGAMAKPGAGACCVRGHSNVQGDRTMGVWERPQPEFLNALAGAFHFDPPREHGLDAQKSIVAMHEGRVKVFVSLGGNFLLALPDTMFAAEALSRTNLTVRIGTKLNRSDLVSGRQALILPCLGRTEVDVVPLTNDQPAREQFVSCENAMGVIQSSRGRFAPASPHLMGETAIVCRMAHAVLGTRTTIDWQSWADDYDLVRDAIAKVIPGCHDYNARVRHSGGFYLPNPPRENVYHTTSGKANFTVNAIPKHQLQPDQFVMTTVRSHDQFNTSIYGMHDRYRGLHNERRIVMLNREDLKEQGLAPKQIVDITSHWEGQTRTACGFVVVEYPIPRRCAAMYYPEANVLIPIGSTEPSSNCPTFKHTVITIKPAANRRS